MAGAVTRRTALTAFALATGTRSAAPAPKVPDDAAFGRFLLDLWPDAAAAGVSRTVFDAAIIAIGAPDPAVLARMDAQSEFSRPISAYVEGAAAPGAVSRGRALSAVWASTLDMLDARTGVPRSIILAIWGVESGFGRDAGSFRTLRSLATLAITSDRGARFRTELVAALRIAETEGMAPAGITGSWAGAMGQTQFLPSSFLAHAADGDGDGRRDIWNSVPDVLASIGKFLADAGWKPDVAWGYEVALPAGLDLADFRRTLAAWRSAGLTLADGGLLPAQDADAQLYFPAGIAGPAVLLTDNFEAIRAYNTSDAYALGIGLLSERIAGRTAFRQPWPKLTPLTGAERREVHERLAKAGFYEGARDGKFGAVTRAAIRRFQVGQRIPADGFADRLLLEKLRGTSGR